MQVAVFNHEVEQRLGRFRCPNRCFPPSLGPHGVSVAPNRRKFLVGVLSPVIEQTAVDWVLVLVEFQEGGLISAKEVQVGERPHWPQTAPPPGCASARSPSSSRIPAAESVNSAAHGFPFPFFAFATRSAELNRPRS